MAKLGASEHRNP